jgi:hypothetical protein
VLVAGIDMGERLIAQVEAVKNGGTSDGTVPPPVPAVAVGVPSPRPMPPLTDTNFGQVVDALPPRPGKFGPTHGQVFDETGSPIGTPVRSHREPGLHHDLDLPARARRGEPMNSHIEAKVAAGMRRGDLPQHVSVVINNRNGPCGWRERRDGRPLGGVSCDDLISDIIPPGSTMTVRWRDADGWGRRQDYHGTGRRIRT